MIQHLQFVSREEFRNWLHDNCLSSNGVWLLFGKSGGPKTIKAGEALEEGLMTNYGRTKIEEAKKNGQWDVARPPAITDEQIAFLSDILKEYEPAYTNFQAMSQDIYKGIF